MRPTLPRRQWPQYRCGALRYDGRSSPFSFSRSTARRVMSSNASPVTCWSVPSPDRERLHWGHGSGSRMH